MKRVCLLVAASALLLFGAGTSSATQPLTGDFLFDYDGCDPDVYPPDFRPVYDCGDFMICEGLTIGGSWKLFFDNEGNPVKYREKQQVVGGVYESSNPDNLVPYTQSNFTYQIDELTGDQTVSGVFALITVPGHGQIFKDVGRLMFDLDDNITFEAGEHEWFNSEWDAVCALLAGN